MYRLEGPNCWEGAKQAIVGMPERVKMPLQQCDVASRTTKKKRCAKGLLDRHFSFATSKCFALYLAIAVAIGGWLFAHQSASPFYMLMLFTSYTLVLGFVALLAFIFHIDFVWL